jgi:hypothetical protein
VTLIIRAGCLGDIQRYDFQWPEPPDLHRFEIVGSSSGNIAKETAGGRRATIREFRYILRPVGRGQGRIGSVTLNYTDKLTQEEYALNTRPITVDVTEPVVAAGGGFGPGPGLLVGLLVLMGVVGVVFFVRRRRRGKEEMIPPDEDRHPEAEALEKLERLPTLRLEGDIKAYYSLISDTFRAYIDRKYALRTIELTTPDMLHHLREKGIEEEAIAEIEAILGPCDMVKFARHQPAPSDLDAIASLARAFFAERTAEEVTEGDNGQQAGGTS